MTGAVIHRGLGIAWSWMNAAHGALLAVPAVVGTLVSPDAGLPLALGVLPAAALGLQGRRGRRAMVLLVGIVAAVSFTVGSLVAPWPALAVVTILGLSITVAALVPDPRRRLAPIVLMLGVPLVGVGLSETPSAAVGTGLLMIAGSVYGWLVSLPWPDRPGPDRSRPAAAPRAYMLVYGLQIGAAGAAGAALGFALGVDHPGWACAAALLISRPSQHLLEARSVGRVVAVLLGALIACIVAALSPSPLVLVILALLCLVGAAGTSGSRWYVMPMFSTLLVLTMLIRGETDSPEHWFLERLILTMVGAALALLSAWACRPLARRAIAIAAD